MCRKKDPSIIENLIILSIFFDRIVCFNDPNLGVFGQNINFESMFLFLFQSLELIKQDEYYG